MPHREAQCMITDQGPCVWRAGSPQSPLSLKCWQHGKKSEIVKRKTHLKLQTYFLMFKQPESYKNGTFDAAITNRGYYWWNECVWIDAILHTIEDHKLFKKINPDGNEETGKSRIERGHWVPDICYSCSKLWTLADTRLTLSIGVNLFQVFDITCVALLVKQGTFLI